MRTLWKKMRLNVKLMAMGMIVMLLPLLVIAWFAVDSTTKRQLADSELKNQLIADKLAESCDLAIRYETRSLRELSVAHNVIDITSKINASQASEDDVQRLDQRLSDAIQQLGADYETLIVIDLQGYVVAEGTAGNKGIKVMDREYFQEAKKGALSIGKIVLSKKSQQPVLPIAVPIKGKDGNPVGVIAGIIKAEALSERVTSTKIGDTGYGYILDAEGRMIAHPKSEFVLKLELLKEPGLEVFLKKVMGAKESGVERYTFRGVHKVSGFAPMNLAGWKVCTTQNIEEFLLPIHKMRNGIILISGISTVISLIIIYLFSRNITRPIMQAVESLTDSAAQVASASDQLSSNSGQLASGASEQAASLEETSSALEEMASMTSQNAGNAREATGIMQKVNETFIQANRSMNELATSMQDITTASEETQKIVKTIDEIAFQTNLLALNAAVEAARAGQAGAGFAVVADEVRNLALRAAEAARNTAGLIEGTAGKIMEGAQTLKATHTDFSEVGEAVTKAIEIVGEIASASQEQSQGVDQINQAVSEMDTIVQRTAAQAEESASASEELSAQATGMNDQSGILRQLVMGDMSK